MNDAAEGIRAMTILFGLAFYFVAMCIGLYLVFKFRNWDGQ